MNKGGNKGKFLFHSVGICVNGLSQILGQLKHIGEFGDSLFPVCLRNTVDIRNKINILNARKEFVEIRIVGNICHHFLALNWVLLYGNTSDIYFSVIEFHYSRAGFYGGGLSRSVMTYESIDLSRLNMQG